MRDRASSILRHQRAGVCHRCGWRGLVGKVRGRDRKFLASGRSFGRLCDDCVTDLFLGQTALRDPQSSRHVKLTVVESRDVA